MCIEKYIPFRVCLSTQRNVCKDHSIMLHFQGWESWSGSNKNGMCLYLCAHDSDPNLRVESNLLHSTGTSNGGWMDGEREI